MGQIVPDLVERYPSGLNRAHDSRPLIRSHARAMEQDLPLVDAEVGALLQVLASAVGQSASPRNRHVHRLLPASWLARALPADGMLFTMEMNRKSGRVSRKPTS